MAYLLDADIFIGAKNLHYGFDFCPAFWDWLDDRNAAGSVFSVEKVGDEVQSIADDLSVWAAARGSRFVLPPGSLDFPSLAVVSAWAAAGHYVHEPFRDAPARACAIRSRSTALKRTSDLLRGDAKLAKAVARRLSWVHLVAAGA